MRLLLSIIFIAISSFVFESFFSWWSLSIVCFLAGLLHTKRTGKSFLIGFLGVALMWFFVAFKQDFANDHILASRMATLFHLPNSMIFILVASIIGGIVGGLSAWTGAVLRKNFI